MKKFASQEYNILTLNVYTHYTIVTILNWDAYQSQKNDDVPPMYHQCTTNVPPVYTNNNDNNDKNNNVVLAESQNIESFIQEEYYPTEEVQPELFGKPETPVAEVLRPESSKTLFRNSVYGIDRDALLAKFKDKEYEGVDLNYYYDSVYDWSDTKDMRRTANGWVATMRNFIRGDAVKNKLVTLKKSQGGYGVTDEDFLNFMNT